MHDSFAWKTRMHKTFPILVPIGFHPSITVRGSFRSFASLIFSLLFGCSSSSIHDPNYLFRVGSNMENDGRDRFIMNDGLFSARCPIPLFSVFLLIPKSPDPSSSAMRTDPKCSVLKSPRLHHNHARNS